MWDELQSNVNQAVSKFIPKSKKGMSKGPDWLDKTVLESVKIKHKMWNKFQKHNTSENWSTYIQARNRATKVVKMAKRNSEQRVQACGNWKICITHKWVMQYIPRPT